MRSIAKTARRLSLGIAFVGVLATHPLPSRAQEPAGTPSQTEAAVAEVLSPQEGERVPRKDEDPSGLDPIINVKGKVSKGLQPFFAVAPLNAAPRVWIQPPIVAVKKDGTFQGIVFLGTRTLGAGEKYNLLVLACQDKKRFQEGQVLMSVPDDCVVSDPVTVLRTK